MFIILSANVFAEIWIVTDSLDEVTEWVKESGVIPLEYFSCSCIKECSGTGNGIMHTTSDNYTTFDVNLDDPISSEVCHQIFVGKKDWGTASGDFLSVCKKAGSIVSSYDGTWSAIISDGDGESKKPLTKGAKESIEKFLVKKSLADKESN